MKNVFLFAAIACFAVLFSSVSCFDAVRDNKYDPNCEEGCESNEVKDIRMFSTAPTQGNLGGRAGADSKCNQSMNNIGDLKDRNCKNVMAFISVGLAIKMPVRVYNPPP